MANFTFPKSVSEIEGAVTLPAGYYRARLVQEPVIADNKKKRDGLSAADGAGQNLVLKFRTISEDPVENGRAFTKWLPLPRPGIDENEFDPFTGQPLLDKKMETIVKWVQALNGTIEEDSFELEAGSECAIPLIIEDREGVKVNSIDMNADPKPL